MSHNMFLFVSPGSVSATTSHAIGKVGRVDPPRIAQTIATMICLQVAAHTIMT